MSRHKENTRIVVQEPQILNVYKTRMIPLAKNNPGLPLIFKILQKKGTQPVYMTYQTFKNKHPNTWSEFLEKHLIIRDHVDEITQKPRKNLKRSLDDSDKEHPAPQNQQQGSHGGKKQSPNRSKLNERICRIHRERYKERNFRKQVREREVRQRGFQQRQKIRDKNLQEDEEDFVDLEDLCEPERQQVRPMPKFSKILDYDCFVDDLNFMNLISPAVIPMTKSKPQSEKVNYIIPPRINFKQVEREQYSSESFKESEYSEFLVDERGKEKRRKEKLLREQERQLKKKKRVKKLKKKRKPVNKSY